MAFIIAANTVGELIQFLLLRVIWTLLLFTNKGLPMLLQLLERQQLQLTCKILSRSAETIVFCFDGDKAGKRCSMEGSKTSLPSITSGLIIKFLILPEGEDPDTLINRESSKAFSKRIEGAQTLSSFLD